MIEKKKGSSITLSFLFFDMNTTATYLHRVDSASSHRLIIVRQMSFKLKPTMSTLKSEQNSQKRLPSISRRKKQRKSLFK